MVPIVGLLVAFLQKKAVEPRTHIAVNTNIKATPRDPFLVPTPMLWPRQMLKVLAAAAGPQTRNKGRVS